VYSLCGLDLAFPDRRLAIDYLSAQTRRLIIGYHNYYIISGNSNC